MSTYHPPSPDLDRLPELIRALSAEQQARVVDVAMSAIADAEFDNQLASDPAQSAALEASLIAASEEGERVGCSSLAQSKAKVFDALKRIHGRL